MCANVLQVAYSLISIHSIANMSMLPFLLHKTIIDLTVLIAKAGNDAMEWIAQAHNGVHSRRNEHSVGKKMLSELRDRLTNYGGGDDKIRHEIRRRFRGKFPRTLFSDEKSPLVNKVSFQCPCICTCTF